MSYTPGPWKVSDEKTASGSPIKCIRREDGKSAYNIAVLGDRTPSPGQWGPNAHLIAAAPDLLAALKTVERLTTDLMILTGVRMAIAKAEGK